MLSKAAVKALNDTTSKTVEMFAKLDCDETAPALSCEALSFYDKKLEIIGKLQYMMASIKSNGTPTENTDQDDSPKAPTQLGAPSSNSEKASGPNLNDHGGDDDQDPEDKKEKDKKDEE